MAAPERSRTARGALVLIEPEQLTELVREAVRAELEGLLDGVEEKLLVDREGLARTLGCSVGTIDALRRRGLPELRLAENTPRFDPKRCLAWIEEMNRAAEASDG